MQALLAQARNLERALATYDNLCRYPVDDHIISKFLGDTMVLGASIRALSTELSPADPAISATLISKYAGISGKLRAAIINLQKHSSTLSEKLNTKLTNYRTVDYNYSSEIGELLTKFYPKGSEIYTFASMHTEGAQ